MLAVGSPSDPKSPRGQVKLGYIHYNIRRGEAEPHISNLNSMVQQLPSVGPKLKIPYSLKKGLHFSITYLRLEFFNQNIN